MKENRAGKLVTNLGDELAYQSFRPSFLPVSPALMMDDEMVRSLLEAKTELAHLQSVAQLVPNVHQYLSMYVRKEALMSAQIEGTQATLEDVFGAEFALKEGHDVEDVVHYIKAMEYAISSLERLPLCARLIKETHKVLLGEGRGSDKRPGEFRSSQNWIGPAGCSLSRARYIPPNVEDMGSAMANLEKYINEDTGEDPLIKAALIHYQFETIHPFLDGNGRIGRLLILLYLLEQGVLSSPVLYVSYYLKANRTEYYDRISMVRKNGDYEQWVRFFLRSLTEAARDGTNTIIKLSEVHRKHSAFLASQKRHDNMLRLLDYLSGQPIVDVSLVGKALGLSYNGAAKMLEKFVEFGILKHADQSRRNRRYLYSEYLDLLREGTL